MTARLKRNLVSTIVSAVCETPIVLTRFFLATRQNMSHFFIIIRGSQNATLQMRNLLFSIFESWILYAKLSLPTVSVAPGHSQAGVVLAYF